MPKLSPTPKTPPEDYEPFTPSPRRALEILENEKWADYPPPAAPDTSARAVVVVIPPGPYAPADYADAAAAIAREFSNWPTPAPQLAEALRRAVCAWADAQETSH